MVKSLIFELLEWKTISPLNFSPITSTSSTFPFQIHSLLLTGVMKDLQEFQKEINSFFDGNLLKRKDQKNSNSSFSILRLILFFYFRSKSETSPLRMIFFHSIYFTRKGWRVFKNVIKSFFSFLLSFELMKTSKSLCEISSSLTSIQIFTTNLNPHNARFADYHIYNL